MIGIRELRADLAAHVRRASGGEPTLVSVGGRPAAALVPLSAMNDEGAAATQLSSLVSSGALIPPRRADAKLPVEHITVWGNARLDRLLREIRG
jgi:prevent-host-death family protein